MPTENPRVTITMTEEQLHQINEFRYGNQMKNQTQAILSLISKGFEEIERQQSETSKENKKSPPHKNDGAEAKKKSNMELFSDVLERAGIIKPGCDLTDSDKEFLKAMYVATKAYFKNREEQRD